MSNPWDFQNEEEDDELFVQEEQTPQKRKAGRPLNSKNKTVTQKLILEQFEDLYGRVESMLSDEQKKYYREAFRGNKEFDALSEAKLFARLYSVYVIKSTTEAIGSNEKPSKELAENVNQYRQILNNIEEMTVKRNVIAGKEDESRGLVDPLRESALGRFESIIR